MAKKKELTEAQRKLVGGRIRAAREALGMKATELAYRADLSPNHLSVIELGKSKPTAATLGRIAKVLGCTPEFLIEGAPVKKNGKRNGNGGAGNGK